MRGGKSVHVAVGEAIVSLVLISTSSCFLTDGYGRLGITSAISTSHPPWATKVSMPSVVERSGGKIRDRASM